MGALCLYLLSSRISALDDEFGGGSAGDAEFWSVHTWLVECFMVGCASVGRVLRHSQNRCCGAVFAEAAVAGQGMRSDLCNLMATVLGVGAGVLIAEAVELAFLDACGL